MTLRKIKIIKTQRKEKKFMKFGSNYGRDCNRKTSSLALTSAKESLADILTECSPAKIQGWKPRAYVKEFYRDFSRTSPAKLRAGVFLMETSVAKIYTDKSQKFGGTWGKVFSKVIDVWRQPNFSTKATMCIMARLTRTLEGRSAVNRSKSCQS